MCLTTNYPFHYIILNSCKSAISHDDLSIPLNYKGSIGTITIILVLEFQLVQFQGPFSRLFRKLILTVPYISFVKKMSNIYPATAKVVKKYINSSKFYALRKTDQSLTSRRKRQRLWNL